MLTRRHIRRWLTWSCTGLGFIGLAGYAFSGFTAVTHSWGGSGGSGVDRTLTVGRGGVSVFWTFTDTSTFYVAGSFSLRRPIAALALAPDVHLVAGRHESADHDPLRDHPVLGSRAHRRAGRVPPAPRGVSGGTMPEVRI